MWKILAGSVGLMAGAMVAGGNAPELWRSGAAWWEWLAFLVGPLLAGSGGLAAAVRAEAKTPPSWLTNPEPNWSRKSDKLRGEFLHALSDEGALLGLSETHSDDWTEGTLEIRTRLFSPAAVLEQKSPDASPQVVPSGPRGKPWHTMALLACVLLAGCYGGGDAEARPNPKPQPTPAASSLWTALADRIEADKIKTTDELVMIVRELRKDGDIDDGQLSAFNALGLDKQDQPAKPIADRVRGLK